MPQLLTFSQSNGLSLPHHYHRQNKHLRQTQAASQWTSYHDSIIKVVTTTVGGISVWSHLSKLAKFKHLDHKLGTTRLNLEFNDDVLSCFIHQKFAEQATTEVQQH